MLLQEHPEKSVDFVLQNDLEQVIYEEDNKASTDLLTLRKLLIKIEAGGLVDFEVAGHDCSRTLAAEGSNAKEDKRLLRTQSGSKNHLLFA